MSCWILLQVNLLLERTIESLFPGQVPRPSMEGRGATSPHHQPLTTS